MTQRTIVFDFDGTITDAEKEGANYHLGYLEDIATLCAQPTEKVLELAKEFTQEVLESPEKHGWIYNEMIVAPASVDPYLRLMPVARKVLQHFNVLTNQTDQMRVLDGILYKYNYPKTETHFREGATQVFQELPSESTFVVTNSHTDPVQRKIRSLSEGIQQNGGPGIDWLVQQVHGSAKKYVVDPDCHDLPEALEMPGLPRPVLLRRRLYWEKLQELLAKNGHSFEQLWVIGDIFELDLALPLHLGANVVLMTNKFTPGYERQYLDEHPRGHLASSLAELKSLV